VGGCFSQERYSTRTGSNRYINRRRRRQVLAGEREMEQA
jgi:hypothetical protein